MKNRTKTVIAWAVALLTGLPMHAALTNTDFLQANGRNLRKNYGQGDVVQLKGTNLGGWLIQEFWMTPTNSVGGVNCERDIYNKLTERFGENKMREIVDIYQSNYLKESDFDNMASMGMNCVRLPFWWRNLTDAGGSLYADWYKYIDWTVAQAKARNMYVIIDFHGAPGSQNGSDHSGVDGGDDKKGASEFFFGANATANQNLYYSLWETIAARYKDEPAVAGYDLLNEPYCTYRYNSGYSADQLHTWLWNIYNTAYQRIRAIDNKHVIIMEATWDPVDLPNPATYGWTNVMYEYHNYLYDDYDNNEGRQITNMQNKINAIRNAAYNVPSYMGEFCYFNNLTAWDQGLALLNNTGINWTTWTYKVVSTYGNWGLVNQNVSSTNVATDSEANIRTKWANVGSSYNNTGLINVASTYFNKPAVKNNLGPAEPSGDMLMLSVRTMEIAQTGTPQYGGWTRYEGESAYIKGGAVENQTFYSGGAGVGSLNTGVALANVATDWSNINYVRFNVHVPTDGVYRVLLQYNGDDDKMILARTPLQLYALTIPAVSPLHIWDNVHVALLDLQLQGGDNELYLSGTVNNASTWLNIDCIDVCRIPLQINGTTTRYEAEYGIIKANRAVGEEQQSFYSNLWGVGGMGSNVALNNVANDLSNVYYVVFPLFVETAGTYQVVLAYNGNGNTMTAKYRLNNGNATTYTMNNQGRSWNQMNEVVLNLNLQAGMNSITFAGSSTGSWDDWVNFDYVEVRPVSNGSVVVESEPSMDRCSSSKEGARLRLSHPERVFVYTLSGKMVGQYHFDAGDQVLYLSSGSYVVATQSSHCKVLVP